MPDKVPVVTIQCDWNEIIRLPKGEGWISSKYLNENSTHEKFTTSVQSSDNKIKITLPKNYQYISHSNLSLIIKHVSSNLKVVFVAPTKAHKVHEKGVLSVSTAENALAVSSCEGDKLLVWDSRTSEVLLNLKGHGGPVYKCRFFPSGVVVLSAGADGSLRVWSAETGVNPVTLAGHQMAVTDMCIVDRGRNVISVSRDGCAKLWDVGQSTCLDNIFEGHGPINCCALGTTTDEITIENDREIGTGNKLLVIGCESGTVLCAHVGRRSEIFSSQLEAPCNTCAVVDNKVIVGCCNGTIFQLNIETGAVVREWAESANPVLSIAALPNDMFAVGRQDGTCIVYSMAEGFSNTRVQLTGSDCDGIRDIAFNGKWICAASRDTNIRKYDFNQVTVHFK